MSDVGRNSYSIDYNIARSFYPQGVFVSGILQNEFGPAFLTTNEALREMIPAYGNLNGDVLTVAASGDQPMMYKALGARRVDTFDMTYSAKAVMDLKCVAVQNMSYKQYAKFLKRIAVSQPRGATSQNLLTVEGVIDVVEKMPPDTAEFICQMSLCNIFSSGTAKINLPTSDEYAKMQNSIKEPFNFIWTDIVDLNAHLTKQYDVINISNILEWIDMRSMYSRFMIHDLFYRLKPNGYIVASAFMPRSGPTESAFRNFAEWNPDRARVDSMYTSNEVIFSLRRTR